MIGLIPRLAIEYMVMDRLETPPPVVKKLMTKSSMDKVKAIKNPEMMPGMISVMITFLKAYQGVAPKSRAALRVS